MRGSPRRSRVHGSGATAWSNRRARHRATGCTTRRRSSACGRCVSWSRTAGPHPPRRERSPTARHRRSAPRTPAAHQGTVVSGDPIEAFVSAAAALDGDRIEAALDELFGRGSFESIVDAWLMPAAAALGDAWAAGRVTVAGEHAASAAPRPEACRGVRRRGARRRPADRRRSAAPEAVMSSARSRSRRPFAGEGWPFSTSVPMSRSRAGWTCELGSSLGSSWSRS